jgi:cell division protein FtsW
VNPSPVSVAPGKPAGEVDLLLLLVMLIFLVFGLLMVYSASTDFSMLIYKAPMHMFNRQVIWLGLGLVAAYILSRTDYHYWRKLSVPLMLGTITLLAVVLFVNEIRNGAVRTLLGGSIQPSELAKVVTIIYLSVWMHSKREQMHELQWGLFPLGIILGIVGGLIYIQPDLSAAATVFALGGLLFFLAGGDLRQIIFLLILAIIVGMIVVQISSTGHQRVNDYLEGLKDPTMASYHVRRAFEAIVKGGWFGRGLGNATTKLTGLPVPPTDSIFAVIAEELGWVGASATVLLYVLLAWRGLRIAEKAPDMLGSLLASGLTFWLAMEAVINMLVMVGLMPFAGNALPFISAGGSNMLASLTAIGILLNISRQADAGTETTNEWRNLGATVDLRGRNRRRSLPRLVRS